MAKIMKMTKIVTKKCLGLGLPPLFLFPLLEI